MPLRRLFVPTCLLLASLFPCSAFSQQEEDPSRLIFEAVALPLAEQDTPPQPLPAQDAPLQDPALPESSAAGSAATAVTQSESVTEESDQDEATRLQVDIERYRRQIAELGNSDGLFSVNLREQLEALAGLLQQTGDHAAAITELENAMHIERVNQGLFTLDQIPLVEKLIASHDSLGNFQEVNDYQEYLYYIQMKSFPAGDPRLLVAKEEWADQNVEAYLKDSLRLPGGNDSAERSSINDYVAIQNPRDGSFNYVPRNQLPLVLNPYGVMSANDFYLNSTQYAVPPERLIDERLRRARDLYEEIIETQTAEDITAGQAVEHKLANIAFAVKKQIDELESRPSTGSFHNDSMLPPRSTSMLVSREYRKGRDALEKIAVEFDQKLEQDPSANAVEAALAYLYLGDWHTAFERVGAAQDAYRRASEILLATDIAEPAVNAILLPAPLVPAPAFAIHDYSRRLYGIPEQEVLEYSGHMDLTLDVDRFGNVRGAGIDDSSPDTSQPLRETLLDYLREQKMRPAIVNGETVERSDLKIRYYYSY